MSFAGQTNNYTLARAEAKGFRYEFIDPANTDTRAGLFRIRDDSDFRAFSGAFADLHRGERNLRVEWVTSEDFLAERRRSRSAYCSMHAPLCAAHGLFWMARAERHADGFAADRDGNEGMKRRRISLGLRKVLDEGRELRFERRRDRDSGRVTGGVARSNLSVLQMVWFR